MNYKILFINISFLFFFGSIAYSQQGGVDQKELAGTYSFILKNGKDLHHVDEDKFILSPEDFKNLAELRADEEDVKVNLSGKEVILMSRKKVQDNLKWPKYIYERK